VIDNGQQQYTYDPNGNRISEDQRAFYYDAFNRLIQADDVTYTYDSFGRLMTRTENGESQDFLYYGDIELGTLCHPGSSWKHLRY